MNVSLIILSKSLWGWPCYYLYFNDEGTENFPTVVQPEVVKPEGNQADTRAQAHYHLGCATWGRMAFKDTGPGGPVS